MVEMNFMVIIEIIIVIILAISLIFFSFLLLKRLNSKDLAVSMIFLHEKAIKRVFLVIVISSLIFFLSQVYYSLSTDINASYIYRAAAFIYSFALLYFAYKLQNVLKGGETDEQL